MSLVPSFGWVTIISVISLEISPVEVPVVYRFDKRISVWNLQKFEYCTELSGIVRFSKLRRKEIIAQVDSPQRTRVV